MQETVPGWVNTKTAGNYFRASLKHVLLSLAIRVGHHFLPRLPAAQFVRQFLFCPASNFHLGIFGVITFFRRILRHDATVGKKISASIFRLVSHAMAEIYLAERGQAPGSSGHD